MVFTSATQTARKWGNLNCDRGELSDLQLACIICGGTIPPWITGNSCKPCPKIPVDMVDDLVKMGLYKENQLRAADGVNAYELRKALFLKRVGVATRARKADSGAVPAGWWFRQRPGRRVWPPGRAVLQRFHSQQRGYPPRVPAQHGVGAALVTLASVPGVAASLKLKMKPPVDTSSLEKTDLQIGFIPITCASPIIMSEPLGFYEKHGLNATVVKMPSWGAVRDSAIAGELDAYHMLAPMPIAMTLGWARLPSASSWPASKISTVRPSPSPTSQGQHQRPR
jgi:nitrate/nitrite transport system substrate-binding protein